MKIEITETRIIKIIDEDKENWTGSYEILASIERLDLSVDVNFQYTTDRDLFILQLKSWDMGNNRYSINEDGTLHLILLNDNITLLDLLKESLTGDFKMKPKEAK